MILRDKKILFIHNPKTAGSSVEVLLGGLDGANLQPQEPGAFLNQLKGSELYFPALGDEAIKEKPSDANNSVHYTMAIYQNKIFKYHRHYREEDIDEYFKFSFVRNPFDRVLSAFLWKMREGEFQGSFSDYVSSGNYELHPFGMRQVDYFYTENKRSLDYIGRFENFAEEIASIFNGKLEAGIDLQQVPFVNAARDRRNDYRSYYDRETRSTVELLFKDDLDQFGYSW